MDARTPKGWTPLSYAVAKGKYGATEEKGIYPEVQPLCAQKWVNNRSCKRVKHAMVPWYSDLRCYYEGELPTTVQLVWHINCLRLSLAFLPITLNQKVYR